MTGGGMMQESRRPWSSVEQAALLRAVRAGEPPARWCSDLGRSPQDVGRRLSLLLGDAVATVPADADLDLLWLRVRATSIGPVAPSPEQVVGIWERATGSSLTMRQHAELVTEPAVVMLAEFGRYALRVTAETVVRRAGMLDLDDWAQALSGFDAVPGARRDRSRGAVTALLAAVVEDIAPPASRHAVARHLGLADAAPEFSSGRTADDMTERRDRKRGIVEACRAACLPGRPASHLCDLLQNPTEVRTLVREVCATSPATSFAVATTLGMLGGRHEVDALHLAGRLLTPWGVPPNLGRGAVVRLPS